MQTPNETIARQFVPLARLVFEPGGVYCLHLTSSRLSPRFACCSARPDLLLAVQGVGADEQPKQGPQAIHTQLRIHGLRATPGPPRGEKREKGTRADVSQSKRPVSDFGVC